MKRGSVQVLLGRQTAFLGVWAVEQQLVKEQADVV